MALELLRQNPWLLFVCFFALSAAMTGGTRWIANRVGFVSKPRGDRWNTRVVALGGGIAMISCLLFALLIFRAWDLMVPLLAVFILGWVDDYRSLSGRGVSPSSKLIVQTMAACYLVTRGYGLPFTGLVTSMALTIVWIVVLTNSINLIDNMDGLAAGVSLLSFIGLGFQLPAGLSHLAIAGAGVTAGFLLHNFHPAKIFMGDAGSLSLGLILSALATRVSLGEGTPSHYALVLPALFLLVPIFDTALVMTARKSASRPLMVGGRDHSSHRLVALGLTEKGAVMILYAFASVGVVCANLMSSMRLEGIVAATAMVGVLALLFGLFLVEVRVYQAPASAKPISENVFQMIQVLIDILIIAAAWTIAHMMRFNRGSTGSEVLWTFKQLSILPVLPYLIVIKLIVMAAFGLYRTGVSRTQMLKAATLATLVAVMIGALATRLTYISRVVIVMDWVLTCLLVLASREAIARALRYQSRQSAMPARSISPTG